MDAELNNLANIEVEPTSPNRVELGLCEDRLLSANQRAT
jgi:hypothetical protein